MTSAEILFGSLPLLSSSPSLADYTIEAVADGTDFGNPSAVVAAIASMLMDGDRGEVTRFGNRVATVGLRVRGATLDDVAAGEAAIMAEVSRGGNTLSWLPPNWATLSIFDVVYATLDFRFDDLGENRVERYFTLTLTCLPFARRETLTTVVAEPITTPTLTTIDDCSSTTGWSGSDTVVLSGGAVTVTPGHGNKGWSATLERSGLSVTLSPGEFVVVELDPTSPPAPIIGINGVSARIVASESTPAGTTRWYALPATYATITTVSVALVDHSGKFLLAVHEVASSDGLPAYGTTRQRSFTAVVGGTARTTADLTITGSTDLGSDVIAYTAPAGTVITPPLRRFRSSGDSETTDAATVSGKRNTLSAATVFTIPAALFPSGSGGTHVLMARLRRPAGASTIDIDWAASMSGWPWGSVNPASKSDSTSVDLDGNWSIHELCVIELPMAAVGDSSMADVEISIDTSAVDIDLDEAWLFNLDEGVLTWLSDLETTVGLKSPSEIVIGSATVDRDRPTWMGANAGDDTTLVSVAHLLRSLGKHEFGPGVLNCFAVTTRGSSQTVTLDLYERFQHNVTPPAA